MAASTGRAGLGALLQLGGVTIAQMRNMSPNPQLDTSDVTPLGAVNNSQHIPGLPELTVGGNGFFLADVLGGPDASRDLVNEWATRNSGTYTLIYPTLDTNQIVAFIRSLNIRMGVQTPVTFDLDLRVQKNASDELITFGTGTLADQTSSAVIGHGLELLVAHTSGDAPVKVAEVTEAGFNLSTGEAELTHVSSGVKEFVPTFNSATLDFTVNLHTSAVASLASHYVETGSTTQPSLLDIWRNRKQTDWKLKFKNEPGTGVGPANQVWSFSGALTGLPADVSPENAMAANGSMQINGGITITEE